MNLPTNDDEALKRRPQPTLAELLEAVQINTEANAARKDSLDSLQHTIEQNTQELESFRSQIDDRPTARQVNYQRKRTAALLLLFGFVLFFLTDAQVQHCSPGSRSEKRLNSIIGALPLKTLGDLKHADESVRQPPYCDITYPLHNHNDGNYPSQWNLLGFGIYLALAVSIGAWVRYDKEKNDDDA
jgi:hypothetical protein